MCAVNVQNRVSQATALLPSEVNQIGVRVVKRQSSQVIMYSLTSDGRYDDEFLTNYNAINLIPALKRIEGVGDASSFSEKVYAMRIWLNPDVMKQHSLVPSDITAVLAEQNIEAAPGNFGQQSNNVAFEYAMRYTGRFRTAEEFGNIIIKSDNAGQTLKLRDIAKIELGGQGYSVSMKNNGIPSVMTMVQQVAGSNANEIAKQVKAELESQKKLMPPGMEVKINYDVTEFLYASIEEVVFTLFMTLALVFLVVYIFLQDMRSTLIPLIAVPVSLVGTFFFLNLMGFSINLLVLSALLLAIAIVVDDAIVVVEAVHAKLDQGYKSALTASIDAMNEISGAIISITLVMAAVFVPVSFIGGTSGYCLRFRCTGRRRNLCPHARQYLCTVGGQAAGADRPPARPHPADSASVAADVRRGGIAEVGGEGQRMGGAHPSGEKRRPHPCPSALPRVCDGATHDLLSDALQGVRDVDSEAWTERSRGEVEATAKPVEGNAVEGTDTRYAGGLRRDSRLAVGERLVFLPRPHRERFPES